MSMKPDRMIGKEFGVRDGISLIARRATNFHLYRTVPTSDLQNQKIVFTTDQGQFYGTAQFIGCETFNILNIHLVDDENQLVCSGQQVYRFPIPVEPAKLIQLADYQL